MTTTWRTLGPNEIDHELLWSLLGIVTGALAVAMLLVFGLPPYVCPFKSFTGLPCVTCGATRALLALAQGAWRESLALHPLVCPGTLLGVVCAPYALAVSLFQRPRLRVELTARDWRLLRVTIVATTAVVWGYLIAVGR
jgi:hypothetical protein